MITRAQADKLLRLALVQTRTFAASVSAKRGYNTEQLDLYAEIAEENYRAYVNSLIEEKEETRR